jgi:hypothetical protein
MEELYEVYLIKHKTQPFVMLDEMDLSFEQFVEKINSSYVFNHMWGYDKKETK